jgi:hypothetical protein
VQEPKHHVNVDRYVVAPDGTLSGPTPVKLMSIGGGPITAASVDGRARRSRSRTIQTRGSSSGSSAASAPTTGSTSTSNPLERVRSRSSTRS